MGRENLTPPGRRRPGRRGRRRAAAMLGMLPLALALGSLVVTPTTYAMIRKER